MLAVVSPAIAYDMSSVDGDWPAGGVVGGTSVAFFDGVANADYLNGNGLQDQVRWGTGPNGQSGLGFTGRAALAGIADDTPFEVGELEHFNRTIDLNTWATEAQLDLTVTFSTPTGVATTSLVLGINETPNDDPGPPAPDDVISLPDNGGDAFIVGNTKYVFTLLGFGPDAGTILPEFVSAEGTDNTTLLWGKLVATPVPAPGAILLGGLGTCLVSWLRRRRAL
jgi:hypothetical protein